jgi:hypothetical protein
VPKVGMMRDQAGRVRALTRDEYVRLLAELPEHLRDMAQFPAYDQCNLSATKQPAGIISTRPT